jgi:hypothetical protein
VSTTAFGIAVMVGLAAAWAGLVWMLRESHSEAPAQQDPPRRSRAGGRPGTASHTRRNSHSVVFSTLTVIAISSLIGELATNRDGGTFSLPPGWGAVDGSTGSGQSAATASAFPSPVPTTTVTALVVGDLTECPRQDHSIAELARQLPGPILAVGDIVDPDGSTAHYVSCYEPLWGELKSRIWPVPGNHDYVAARAEPYFSYFGERAGRARAITA